MLFLRLLLSGSVVAILMSLPVAAQEMTVEEYEPRSTLVVPEHPLTRAKYPFVDAHAHFFNAGSFSAARLDSIVAAMDSMNMRVLVNLSGGSGEVLKAAVQSMKGRYPNRFVVFANVDFDGIGEPGWSERAAAQLEQDVRSGAQGLKIYKNLGLYLKDASSARVAVNDPRIDPVWRKAGELGIPVLIHSADPAQFWEPYDRFNERWYELTEKPERRQTGEPTFEQILAEQHDVFRKHPGTTFVNAHLGWMGNDLARLGRLLDEMPNVYTELGAVLAELGRQPRDARAFLTKYQDRVLMGKDSFNPPEYHVYFRVLETADEYFDYYRRRHAFWQMYGMELPDDVLRKVYYENAARIIPGLSEQYSAR